MFLQVGVRVRVAVGEVHRVVVVWEGDVEAQSVRRRVVLPVVVAVVAGGVVAVVREKETLLKKLTSSVQWKRVQC